MSLSGIAKGALLLIGAGIIAERFKAGPGIQALGVGIREIAAAPIGGVGVGLGQFAGGLRQVGEAFGDIGRGFGEIFKFLPEPKEGPPRHGWPTEPEQPQIIYPTTPKTWTIGNGGQYIRPAVKRIAAQPYHRPQPLITDSGGSGSSLLPGGGGNVPEAGKTSPPQIVDQSAPVVWRNTRPVSIGGLRTNREIYML